jgi:GNAT superfamily N-acetyltransferase
MLRPLSRADLPRIRELFARANDMPYSLVRVAEEKCFGRGMAGEPEGRVAGDFEGVSVTCGKHLRILAVDRARRGRGVGTALLRDAESRGARVVAAEPGNYFTPGVPESMTGFFRGYRETASTHNLVAEELPQEIPPGVVRVASATREAVLSFVEQEFGRIWRFEAEKAEERLFYVELDGAIAGFAANDANNRGLGFFGPTGVALPFRGRGLGKRLLLASLADLRRLGYARAVIPWTDAIAFYQRACGAKVEQRFVTMTKEGRES